MRQAPLACVLLTCVLAASALAQQAPPKPDETPSQRAPGQPASPYAIEFKHLRVRIEADGTGWRELSMRVRINDAVAVRQWGQMPLTYAPLTEDLDIRSIEVRKPDGKIVKVGADAVQDLAINQQGISSFVDMRQKHVTVPALQAGDTLAVTVRWIVARPLVRGHAWLEYSFTKDEVVDDEQLDVDVPAALQPVVRIAPDAPPEARNGSGERMGDRLVYRWRTSNRVVATEGDAEEEATEAPMPHVRLTTFRDWAALAQWLGPPMRPAPDAAVRAKAAELTKGLATQTEKIDALYTYVATQIRYVSLSFGVGRFAPHTPAEVLANQYGDCKDKHALLAALLDTIGVKAVPVLVNTTRSISDDVPSPAEFNHVVTWLPASAGGGTWLDSTTEVAPPGMLHAATRDRLAFSLGAAGVPQSVLRTPADPPFSSAEQLEVEAHVTPLGVLFSRVRLTLRGDTELLLRSIARQLPPQGVKEFSEKFAQGLGFKGDVSEFAFGDPLALGRPFEVTFKVRGGGYLDWAASTSKLRNAAGVIDASALDGDAHPLKKDRQVGTPATMHRRLVLRMPDGYKVTAPRGVAVEHRGFRFTSTYEVSDKTLRVTRDYSGQPRTLLAAESAEYTRLARAIAADHAQTFEVTRETKGVPEIPSDVTAGELYHAGYAAYMAKDYDSALLIWRRNTVADPKMANAWSGVGLAAKQLGKHKEAVEAFEKQAALEPSSKRAYKDLGDAHYEADDDEAAVRAYRRHLELNPADGAAYKKLGEIYRDLDRNESAVEVLQKAASLVRDDGWIYIELAEAYLAMKDPKRALAAFESALAVERSVPILTKIAWELADSGEFEGRAVELMEKASAEIATATATVTPASAGEQQLDLMERLAWLWDARGLIALRKGQLDAAVKYFDAAWRLAGESVMSEHLGQAYERMANRKSDALNAYLLARAMTREPSDALKSRITQLAGATDFEPFVKAAQAEYVRLRTVMLPRQWPQGHAKFRAVLDKSGRAVAVTMVEGPEAFRTMESKIGGLQLPLEAPDGVTSRLIVNLIGACGPEPQPCGVVVAPLTPGAAPATESR